MATGSAGQIGHVRRVQWIAIAIAIVAAVCFVVTVLFGWGVIRFLPGHIALTKSTHYMMRMSGCQALGEYRNHPQVDHIAEVLEGCLDDESDVVRVSAVGSLEQLDHRSSTGVLLARVDDSSRFVSMRVRETLARWQVPELQKLLLDRLNAASASDDDLVDAGRLLGYYHTPEAFQALKRVLGHKDDLVAGCAITGLSEYDTPEAWQLIEKSAKRDDLVGQSARRAIEERNRGGDDSAGGR
ncbi:MAG: HEAT repeat domain-containing protein [Armatimonadia bacterium]